MLKNLIIDLAVARELFVRDFFRQFGQRLLGKRAPAISRVRRNIVQLRIKTVIAQRRRIDAAFARIVVQVMF